MFIIVYGEGAVNIDKTAVSNEETQDLPSPQVELDMSFESREDQEQLAREDNDDEKGTLLFIKKQKRKTKEVLQGQSERSELRLLGKWEIYSLWIRWTLIL